MTWNKSVFTKIYSWRSGIAGSRCGGWWRMLVVVACMLLTACSVKYQFTGTSINYDIIKTIQIQRSQPRPIRLGSDGGHVQQ